MVPYVRKSFYKHYVDGMKYCERLELERVINLHLNDSCPINYERYKDFQRAYKYAMDMTEREVHQAVEGMYHNLNTLQSRSGN